MTLDDVRTAIETRNDDAVDQAITALADTPLLQIDSIDLVIAGLRARSAREAVITGWHYKLAAALERAAMSDLPAVDASACARRAARLQRDTLNDGEGATRALVLALRLSAEDDDSLRQAVDAAGGADPATVLLEKAIKRAKGDDESQGRLRRALARLCEVVLKDSERAFFESLKAARKLPYDGLVVDDVYRLALETKRIDEAAAFFQSLAEEGTINARTRATAFNKLGALLEQKGDRGGAFAAYVGSLHHYETKAARKKAASLKDDLDLSTPLPRPVDVDVSTPPAPAPTLEVEPLLLTSEERTGPRLAPIHADPDADTRLGQAALEAIPSDGGFGSDDGAPFMARLPVADDDNEDVDADDAIVDEEQLVPPPLPPGDDDDDDDDVDDELLSEEELEHSVAVPRFDLTLEREQASPTMTMPPADETALVDPAANDDDDDNDAPPSFLQPPLNTTTTVLVEQQPLFSTPSLADSPVFDDEDDAPMPPPVEGFVGNKLNSAEGDAVVIGDDAPSGVSLAALLTPPGPTRRRGHGGAELEQTSPGATSSSHADLTLPIGESVDSLADEVPPPAFAMKALPPVPFTDGDADDGDDDGDNDGHLFSDEGAAFDVSVAQQRPVSADVSLDDGFPDAAFTMPATGLILEEPISARDSAIARAQYLLGKADGGARVDVVDVIACADELQVVVPGDPRVMRLATIALQLSAPSGDLPLSAVGLVIEDAFRHGDRAVATIRSIQRALPAEHRSTYSSLWLAGARSAGHDVDAIHDLLEEVAASDGPEGPLFSLLDSALLEAGDVDRRDVLHLRAWRHSEKLRDEPRQIELLRRRVVLLQDAHRDGPALQAWTQLTLEHPSDRGTRTDARRFHEQKASDDERARFLARLVRKLDRVADADESLEVLRELLALRVSVDDKVGAEATARDLLGRAPDDDNAIAVLADLLADDPRRIGELVDVLRERADAARDRGDAPTARDILERLARALTTLGRDDDAAGTLVEAARLAPGDRELVDRVIEALLANESAAEAVDLLETLADDAPLSAAGRLLVRAAHLARERLKRLGRARELLEKAVAVDVDNAAALEPLAELLLELGDVNAALSAFEKVAALEPGARARARLHVRLGQILEEQQRDDDALKRYRAAIDSDRSWPAAWEAFVAIARRLGQRDVVAEGLAGLAALESGALRTSTLVKLGRLQLAEHGDLAAATTAFETALATDVADVDALAGLVTARTRAVHGDIDVEAALAMPSPELVDELFGPLRDAVAAGATLPLAMGRLLALGLMQHGDNVAAAAAFEALLDDNADDLPTLLAFARHLAHTSQQAGATALTRLADDRRREVLETVLQHHAFALKPAVHLDVQGEVAALRLAHGDVVGAKNATKKALALLAANKDLDSALSDRAVRAFVLALEDGLVVDAEHVADLDHLEAALRLDLQRAMAPAEKARLKEKQARIAVARKHHGAARRLLTEALQHDPELSSARESLFDLELAGEDPRVVLERSRTLLANERDPQKKAALHLKLFRLQRKVRGSSHADDVAAAEIKAAVELDPGNDEILEAAEHFFGERKDIKGLDELFTTRLKALDRHDVVGRTALLERLAQLRRYDLRDLRGAIDASEAFTALDPEATKPREDAARLHTELGQFKEAAAAWRAVIDRDPLVTDAWRGLFSVLARSRQADEAFAVATTMSALEFADDDVNRAVRAVRPPFPRWPIPPADQSSLKKRLSHPHERTPVRAVFEIIAPRVLARLGRPLEDFGVRRRDALSEARLPPSVVMGVRTASTLAGFRATVPLYLAEAGTLDGTSPAFMALPARDPGLIVTADVVRGGMTPERAFALGRAIAWLSPWALLSAALDTAEIRTVLEALVAAFLTTRDVERPSIELERHGAELKHELLNGLTATESESLTQALLPALRDWVVSRQRLQLSDWKAGVGYSGDRLGFLLSGDLPAALKVIRQAGGTGVATRQAIKELIVFSVSVPCLQLRRELSLSLQDQALAPILDFG